MASQMERLLNDVSHIWHNGGSGSTSALHVAYTCSRFYKGAASVLGDGERGEQQLQSWTFFIGDCAGRFKQMEGPPKEVAFVPAGRQLLRLNTSADMFVGDEARMGFNSGAQAAARLRDKPPNSFACVNLLDMTAMDPDATGVQLEQGELQLSMWRKDIVALVQAQYGVRSASSVPCKVLRCLGRARHDVVQQLDCCDALLTSLAVVRLLVCWECGAMSGGLRQCSRCGIASYRSKEHQQANYGRSHKHWCRGLAANSRTGPTLPFIGPCQRDIVAAVQRSPRAAALCGLTADEQTPHPTDTATRGAVFRVDEREAAEPHTGRASNSD